MHYTKALLQNFAFAISPLCLPTLRQKLVGKVVLFTFPATPPCSSRVDVLETGDVPILFSLSQMKSLGTTIELDPQGDKITCPTFGLYSSPVEYSTTGHFVLDWTSLAYQPKSRERSVRPTKPLTSALAEQKSAYPARTRELDEDEDDQPLVRPDRTAVSEDEDDKPLVQLASREEPLKRESSAERRVPAQLRRRKGPPAWEIHLPHWNKMCQETRSVGRNPDREALQNIINKLSDVRNLKDLHLKHYHMSSA